MVLGFRATEVALPSAPRAQSARCFRPEFFLMVVTESLSTVAVPHQPETLNVNAPDSSHRCSRRWITPAHLAITAALWTARNHKVCFNRVRLDVPQL
jgi:hypothetical protein